MLIVSCAAKNVISEQQKEEKQPQILFLSYTISSTDNDQKKISLIQQKKSIGKLKKKSTSGYKIRVNDLEYMTLDQNFSELEKQIIKNPLIKAVEFVNDLGNFEKRIIALDSAQFTIRLQLLPEVKYIRISELTQSGIKNRITTEIK